MTDFSTVKRALRSAAQDNSPMERIPTDNNNDKKLWQLKNYNNDNLKRDCVCADDEERRRKT